MMVRVLVVDDSATAREIIVDILTGDSDIEVIGTASNGKEAIELTPQLRPDLITMDVVMPIMDGLEALEYIMAHDPTPVLIVTGSSFPKNEQTVFKALSVGALDVVTKPLPKHWEDMSRAAAELRSKVKLLANVKVIRHVAGKRKAQRRGPRTGALTAATAPTVARQRQRRQKLEVAAIAASTGGPYALSKILAEIPDSIAGGVVIVQHIAEGFTNSLTMWLDRVSPLTVREARTGDRVTPGSAYVCPNDYHIILRPSGRIVLGRTPPVNGFRPSADVFFESVAEAYGPRALGVILTGMGEDGARGLKAIRDAGGRTIAQDEETCTVFGMPKAAIERGAADSGIPLDSIAGEIVAAFAFGRHGATA